MTRNNHRKFSWLVLLILLITSGCATNQASGSGPSATGIVTPVPTFSLTDLQPTPTTVPTLVENGQRVVTLADSGQTIPMNVGDRFLLNLGEGYDWTVTVSDPTILSRVVNITVVRGAQGVYEAIQSGRVDLTADGDPLCRNAKPACDMPSRIFQVTIIIK